MGDLWVRPKLPVIFLSGFGFVPVKLQGLFRNVCLDPYRQTQVVWKVGFCIDLCTDGAAILNSITLKKI